MSKKPILHDWQMPAMFGGLVPVPERADIRNDRIARAVTGLSYRTAAQVDADFEAIRNAEF